MTGATGIVMHGTADSSFGSLAIPTRVRLLRCGHVGEGAHDQPG